MGVSVTGLFAHVELGFSFCAVSVPCNGSMYSLFQRDAPAGVLRIVVRSAHIGQGGSCLQFHTRREGAQRQDTSTQSATLALSFVKSLWLWSRPALRGSPLFRAPYSLEAPETRRVWALSQLQG